MIIWLTSYPRSGNTLLRIVLREAFGIRSHSLYDDIDDFGNRPEAAAAVGHVSHGMAPEEFYEKARCDQQIYFVKTHDGPRDDAPGIYVVRDGRSVSVSYAKYHEQIAKKPKTLTDVIVGDVDFGAWGDHYRSWEPEKRPRTLLLRYEDLATNLAGSVDLLARFLETKPIGQAVANFRHLKKLYPNFFRQGTLDGWGISVPDEDKALFWALNAELMAKLNYGDEERQISVDLGVLAAHLKAQIQSKSRALRQTETQLAESKAFADVIDKEAIARLGVIQSQAAQLAQAEVAVRQMDLALKERNLQFESATEQLIKAQARTDVFEKSAGERLDLIQAQAERITQAETAARQIDAVLEERNAEIREAAILLIEERVRIKTLERATGERLELINKQEKKLAQARTAAKRLEATLDQRAAEIGEVVRQLAEEQARAKTLEHAAAERLELISEQAARLAEFDDEKQSLVLEVERLHAVVEERSSEVAHLAADLQAAEGRLHGLSGVHSAVTTQMWQAREHARTLEAQIDARRWHTWRAGLAAVAARRGRWLAEGLLCQVFPPLPQPPAPRISVVTPVFNNADTIRETIESVLNQPGVDLEYIIVDGGSTDGSTEIIREYESRLAQFISEPDNGMYDAIAKGFIHATGDIFAYLNADDVYEHGALARMVEAFRSDPKTQVFYFEDSVTVHGWRFPNRPQRQIDFHHLFRGHILYQDGVFFTRRAYNFVGGLNRSMRAAGDWELWTRLAYRFRFKPLPGHVSSFRIRAGQLSQDMTTYNAEVEEARKRLRRQMPGVERLLRYPPYGFNKLRNRLVAAARCVMDRRRLFFPMDFAQMPPPPGEIPKHAPTHPRDPIDQTPPTELLFSTRDTRFEDRLISYLYYHRDVDVVSYYPPLDRKELKDLYARNYNLKEPAICHPVEGFGSPYRLYRSRRAILRRLSNITLPRKVRGLMSRLGVLQWPDMSLEEINTILAGLVRAEGSHKLKFLDVGCFDGKLLDRLAGREGWDTCGLEPNAEAAEIARGKGHRIWNVEVEESLAVVPPEERFDVIFLGQTIEHFNDPLAAIIQLSQMLARDGVIVLSTPNLHSAQIDLFGPTWSHWHAPYHRHLFSPKSLGLLADRAGMRMVRYRTWSHPSWSWLSLKLHELGLGASVPHGIVIPPEEIGRAESLAIFSRLFYDWRGKGDYIYAAYKKKAG